MSDEEVLLQSPLLYRLVRDRSGALIIEVVVGGIAMSAVRVRLNPQETAAYAREGQAFADRLAKAIMADPPFGGRAVDVP
ncbi:hypothetical protein [Vitiosangium sp. GDMCC 1.1324]|uniref:hypothetical protein n=1 Tax=Vitiosangium sp. (strain GDMCC 1.1324) TaxID=2138576 RepID=UPI000D3B133F|nr:hypothetical protein [Vitiosangium sp. GDMCC 1.1324]PTL85709.1 hypothetical protein DAT35_03110 [Vitiosangium sp. GDMCC 1.1324]